MWAKNSTRLFDGHVEDVGDRLALEADVERLAVVALAVALLARDVDVRQEVHLDLDLAVAAADLAAAALDVEGEAAGLVAAGAGLLGLGVEVADDVEEADVGRRVRPRRAADRRLVDVDDLVQVLEALDALVGARAHPRAVQLVRDGLVEDLVDQRRLARAGHARDRGERAERHLDGHVLEVVLARADDLDVAGWLAALVRCLDPPRAREELPGQGLLDQHDLFGRAAGDDVPAVLAGAWAHVDHVVRGAHRVLVVLDHEHGVAEVAQALQRRDQPLVVAVVQADRRLVEDVEHADQRRADLGRQADPLRLAARTGSPTRAPSTGSRRPRCPGSAAARRSRAGSAARSAGPGSTAPGRSSHSIARLALIARELVDRELADLDRPRLRPQARAVALRARAHRHVLLDLLPRPVGVRLLVAALEVRDDALEGRHVRPLAPHPVAVGDVELLAVGAVEEEVLDLLRELLPRRVDVDLVALGDRRAICS